MEKWVYQCCQAAALRRFCGIVKTHREHNMNNLEILVEMYTRCIQPATGPDGCVVQ